MTQEERIEYMKVYNKQYREKHRKPKKTQEQRFLEKIVVNDTTGCWHFIAGKTKDGYGLFCYNGVCKTAHDASYMIFNGEIPDGMEVMHTCDVRDCVNPEHLKLGTRKDNMQDCVKKGRFKSNSKFKPNERHYTKLTPTDVRNIRNSTYSNKSLAKVYGVHYNTISGIKTRRMWKSLE